VIQSKIVVGGEVEVSSALHPGLRSGPPVVTPIERIADGEQLAQFAMLQDSGICGQIGKIARILRAVVGTTYLVPRLNAGIREGLGHLSDFGPGKEAGANHRPLDDGSQIRPR
jgi:hypothetical protein